MTVRALRQVESGFLADMLYEAIFIPEGHGPLPKAVIQDPSLSRYIENWGKDKLDIAWVAEADHQLVGAVWGRLFNQEHKGFGYVDDRTPELSMAVVAEYRNQGIGTRLMKSIASEYLKLGVEYLSLSVDKANPAVNLYQRLGYTVAGETATSLTMRKRLK
ncbi:hypothetical protein IX84_06610 [Phaeodactylibacter xiamenensis]|uniref:N-acetyltransferase domain-containing protein n=2 Tax=Phaeodactylibacter xiamenensis TaxID=1524460 RepID=A0A098S8F6_9BACT|nr:hypothetical protein IX84_06610 [Phaeodactylibacter xiamenensis]